MAQKVTAMDIRAAVALVGEIAQRLGVLPAAADQSGDVLQTP